MFRKSLFLGAFGTGYVLGARAGRERYEQIRHLALRVVGDPHVQQAAHQAAETAKAEAGPLKDKVTAAVSDTVDHLTHRDRSDVGAHYEADGHDTAATGDLGGGQYEREPFRG
ncbi:hypothetical protein [Marmoricola sp. RAF53]|uniref:hypothetical protein n=1 Tax=Marmoricola sp. RAF53 TaxID=3233059 RepID=UPI003F95FBB3